jgi:hypothetical protein
MVWYRYVDAYDGEVQVDAPVLKIRDVSNPSGVLPVLWLKTAEVGAFASAVTPQRSHG